MLYLNNALGFDGFVPRAAFGKQESQNSLQCIGIRSVPEKWAMSAHLHQALASELFQVMRKGGIGNTQFRLYITHNHSSGMRRQKQSHNAEPCFSPYGSKHIRVARHLFFSWIMFHFISILFEIYFYINGNVEIFKDFL
jgi:hypothetical protein